MTGHIENPRVSQLESLITGGDMANKKSQVLDENVEKINTLNLYQIFEQAKKSFPSFDCLAQSTPANSETGEKVKYHYYSYQEVSNIVDKVAAYLLGLNLEKADGEQIKVGMWMSTSMHMRILMLACHKANFIIVPVYDALGMENVEKIFAKTKISIACVDKKQYYENILSMESVLPNVKKIIKTICHVDGSTKIDDPVDIYEYLNDIIESVDSSEVESTSFPVVDPSEVAFYLSTSGSSGEAKSVIVSHANISCIIKSFRINFDSIRTKLHPNTQITSYMFIPLAHIFGMLVDFALFALNGRTAYPSGNIAAVLKSDLEVVQPHLMTCVPLIIKRAYDATMATVSKLGILKRGIFNLAYYSGILGDLAFKQVRQSFGGRLMLLACGGSKVAPEMHHFVKRVIGAKFVVGYGLTEGLISCQRLDNFTCDLGPPFEFVETKIIDVKEMNYFASQNQGELCVKGVSIFSGYLDNDEETKNAFDEEGFFKTGDIVEVNLIKKDRSNVDSQKVLKYIDRRKNIFKLSQGEYVAPAEIEELYQQSDICTSYFLYGDTLRNFCVAIGFIDKDKIKPLAKRFDVKCEENFTDEKALDALKPKIIKKLNEQVKDLPSFKKAKAWLFTTELPTIENELLTPTQKIKRFAIEKKFSIEIEKLCKEVEAPYTAAK